MFKPAKHFNNMKKIIIYLLLIFTVQVFSQSYKATYKFSGKFGKNTQPIIEEMNLYIQGNKSFFVSKNRIINKTITKEYYKKKLEEGKYTKNVNISANDAVMIRASKYKFRVKWLIEKRFDKNELIFENSGFFSRLRYVQKIPVLNWKLIDSTKVIAGYKTHQASIFYKGRKYFAWFSPEIPISDGPYKFHGLPGLILEIYDEKKDYHFTLIAFEKSNFYPENMFFKGSALIPLIKTTEQKYLKDFYKTFNPDAVMGSSVVIGMEREKYAQERVENLKSKYNNPIELE
jgi:GLPGLI family protein